MPSDYIQPERQEGRFLAQLPMSTHVAFARKLLADREHLEFLRVSLDRKATRDWTDDQHENASFIEKDFMESFLGEEGIEIPPSEYAHNIPTYPLTEIYGVALIPTAKLAIEYDIGIAIDIDIDDFISSGLISSNYVKH